MRTKPEHFSTHNISQAKTMVLLFAVFFMFAACATTSPPPPGKESSSTAFEEGVPGGVTVNTVEVTAKVTAIDTKNRKVTLLSSEGEKDTVKVVPEAVNFDQIRVGDLVKVTVTEELVVYIDKEGTSAPDGYAAGVSVAAKGAQPGGLVAETTRITATVTAIDQANRTATLRFDDGTFKTFPVRDDIDLNRRKVGEKVVFHVTEMIAISVEKP